MQQSKQAEPHGRGEAPGASARSSSGPSSGKIGDQAEDVDWSKISKDTKTTTDIGSEKDPGRLSETKMYKQSAAGRGGQGNKFGGLGDDEPV